jgi:hypothetical protein
MLRAHPQRPSERRALAQIAECRQPNFSLGSEMPMKYGLLIHPIFCRLREITAAQEAHASNPSLSMTNKHAERLVKKNSG